MKVKVNITSLDDRGDQVRVIAQGAIAGAADWRSLDRWEFEVPEYIGHRYQLGQNLTITIKPGKRAQP